jgi:hypothetical protein
MTHSEPEPERGDYPTELDPDEASLNLGEARSGEPKPSDEEAAQEGPEYDPGS